MRNDIIRYGYDYIRLNIKRPESELREILPWMRLRGNAKKFKIIPTRGEARSWGYESQLIIIDPTNHFFEILINYQSELKKYKISHLENYKDTPFRNKYEADQHRELTRSTYCKKWTARIHSVSNDTQTDYYGTWNFQIVRYPRKIKNTNRACLREEFKFESATEVRKKTGISVISDFLPAKTIYNLLESKYVEHVKIDRWKLGLWLIGYKYRKKYPKNIRKKALSSAREFLDESDVLTYAELKWFIECEKKRINRKRGRKSKREKMLLTFQCHKFKKPG